MCGTISVKINALGVRYFSCPPKHGLFLASADITSFCPPPPTPLPRLEEMQASVKKPYITWRQQRVLEVTELWHAHCVQAGSFRLEQASVEPSDLYEESEQQGKGDGVPKDGSGNVVEPVDPAQTFKEGSDCRPCAEVEASVHPMPSTLRQAATSEPKEPTARKGMEEQKAQIAGFLPEIPLAGGTVSVHDATAGCLLVGLTRKKTMQVTPVLLSL